MKNLFTTILAITTLVVGASSQTYFNGLRKPIQFNNEKAPGDTIVAYPPAVDTCQSTSLVLVDAFGTYTLPIPGSPLAVTAVGQKFDTDLASVLAIGGYIQLVGSQSLTPYQFSVNGGTTAPGTALGTAPAITILDTLDAVEHIYYAIALFASPVAVTNGEFYVVGTTTPVAAGDTIRYLLNDCASGTSFLNASGTWINATQGGVSNDVAFEVLGIEGGSNAGVEESIIGASAIMPNPTNDFSVLVYNIKENAEVNIKIMNLAGQVVKQLNEGSKAAGSYSAVINVNDVAAGTYIYQVTANGFSTTGRLVVAK